MLRSEGKKGRKEKKILSFYALKQKFWDTRKKKTHHYKNHTQNFQVRNTDKIHEYLRHINQIWSIISDISHISNMKHLPGGSVLKNPPPKSGDTYSIPGSRRSPGGGNGNPLQDSCLGNSMDRGTWRATVYGVTKRVWHNLATKQPQQQPEVDSQNV